MLKDLLDFDSDDDEFGYLADEMFAGQAVLPEILKCNICPV